LGVGGGEKRAREREREREREKEKKRERAREREREKERKSTNGNENKNKQTKAAQQKPNPIRTDLRPLATRLLVVVALAPLYIVAVPRSIRVVVRIRCRPPSVWC
jgi:Flp pilus assembly protein TadB